MNTNKILKYKFFFIILLLSVFSYLFLGKKPANYISSPQEKETAKLPNNPKHNVVESKKKLINGFPQVPVHPQAEIQNSYYTTDYAGERYEGNWIISSYSPEFTEWYFQAMINDGWEVERKAEGADILRPQTMEFSKLGLRNELMIMPEDGNAVTKIRMMIYILEENI